MSTVLFIVDTVPVYSLFNNMTPALQRHLMMKLMVLLPLLLPHVGYGTRHLMAKEQNNSE